MEKWERWVPLGGIPSTIYNETLIDSKDGLVIEFSDEDFQKKLTVTFGGILLAYRNTDEGCLLKTSRDLADHYGTKFFSGWPLFKVKNSEYLRWFLEESYGIYPEDEIEHYVFCTPDETIEVISPYEPTVVIEPFVQSQ